MDAGEFLAGPEAARAVARAAKVARTPVSVHAYDAGHESDKVAGCGTGAEACAYVHTLPWGPQACRRSREKHARAALKRGRPVPFLCHMGFACVAAPALPETEDNHILTFGPYCPAETPKALQRDAMDGLARLEQLERKELPFSLEDIPLVPAEVVPEVSEWLGETLRKQFLSSELQPTSSTVATLHNDPNKSSIETSMKHASVKTNPDQTPHEPTQPSRRKRATPIRDAFGARAILAAMASPDAAVFREAVGNQLATARRGQSPEPLRARVVAVVAAVIDAAQTKGRPRAAAPTARVAASPLDGLREAVAAIKTSQEAVSAAVRALAPLRRELLRANEGSAALYTGLERYVEERLADSLSLDHAAKHFGLPPSTLTRRLERRYGLTFTGYVARRRVERAKALLARTKLSVETVARRVGLTDGAHLRKLLRRFEGSTPSQARQARQK